MLFNLSACVPLGWYRTCVAEERGVVHLPTPDDGPPTGAYKGSICWEAAASSSRGALKRRRNLSSISRESALWGTVVTEQAAFSAGGRTPMFGSACRPSASSGRSPWSSSLGSSSATTRSPAAAGQSFDGWTTSAATLRMTSTSDIPVSTASGVYMMFYCTVIWINGAVIESFFLSQLAEKT